MTSGTADNHDISYFSNEACKKSDALLARHFNAYLTAMPSRLYLTESKDVGLKPCSLKDATMLLVLGRRLADRANPHDDLEGVRADFAKAHEAFEVFEEAEEQGIGGLDIVKKEFGEFGPKRRQLQDTILINLPSAAFPCAPA